MRKLAILVIMFMILATNTAYANYQPQEYSQNEAVSAHHSEAILAKASSAKIIVNGINYELNTYNIDGYNYIKLRDIASIINKTNKSFNIEWSVAHGAIFVNTQTNYSPVGGELQNQPSSDKSAFKTETPLYIDNSKVNLTSYNIENNNYFMLRDIAKLIDFPVTWDSSTSQITINTSSSYTGESTQPAQSHSAPMTEAEIFEAEVIELVNVERQKLGLSPLTATNELIAAAQIRADEAAVKFSHTRPNGTASTTVFDECGVQTSYRGENLGSGYTTPEKFVSGLMKSDIHRQNILNPSYKHIGVGYNDENVWSQLFTD